MQALVSMLGCVGGGRPRQDRKRPKGVAGAAVCPKHTRIEESKLVLGPRAPVISCYFQDYFEKLAIRLIKRRRFGSGWHNVADVLAD